jgi:coproporphyrinogen III oxidase
MDKFTVANRFKTLQDHICKELESIDGGSAFEEDLWERTEGGGGRTRTFSKGSVIEKGGVAFSEVYGPVSETMKKQLGLDGNEFFATGVSIVLHPHSPHVPIIHMNVRYFELDTGVCWFGGGIDLTPHYVVESQAADFHQSLKDLCDSYDQTFYPKFKTWADDYFYIPHRNETRGVGGIFFDHVTEKTGLSKEKLVDFCCQLGELFPVVYAHQVECGKNKSATEKNIRWRNIRRGRYVEFNLVHDRGTKFGLFSGGRTESILMSLPPDASWEYCHPIDERSEEGETQSFLIKGISWCK